MSSYCKLLFLQVSLQVHRHAALCLGQWVGRLAQLKSRGRRMQDEDLKQSAPGNTSEPEDSPSKLEVPSITKLGLPRQTLTSWLESLEVGPHLTSGTQEHTREKHHRAAEAPVFCGNSCLVPVPGCGSSCAQATLVYQNCAKPRWALRSHYGSPAPKP